MSSNARQSQNKYLWISENNFIRSLNDEPLIREGQGTVVVKISPATTHRDAIDQLRRLTDELEAQGKLT